MAGNDLEIRIGAELTEIKDALASIRKDLTKTGEAGKRSGRDVAQGFDGLERTIGRATTALTGFVSVYSAIQGLRVITQLTDDYARMQAQLKLTTGSQQEMNTAQRETLRIAQETRAPVADVVNTYATLQRSTETLQPSQEELVRVLETVNKSIALTPVNAETARASLTQFGQALAGDFKAGAQELNSILEQTPGLAKAVADGLGVPVSALKTLGEEGKLSTELVFNGLLRVSQQVDEQFREIPQTVGGAFTQLQNDILTTLGTVDVSPLTDGIAELGKTLTDPAVQEGLIAIAGALVQITGLAAEAVSEFASLGKLIGATAASITGNLSPLDEVQIRISEIDAALNNSVLGKPIKFLFTSPEELKALRDELIAEKKAIEATMGLPQQEQGQGGNDQQRLAALKEEAEARMAAAKAAQEQAAADAKAAKEAEARQKQVTQMLASLQEEADTYGKSADEIARYKLEALGATDAEIERAVALARNIEALKAKEQAEEDAAKAAAEAAELQRKLAEELVDVQIRALEASGRTVEATRLRLQTQFADLIRGLQAAGNQAGIELVQNLINTETTRAQFEEIKRQFDQTIADLQARQEALANQVTVGALPAAAADQQQREARDAAMVELQALTAQMQALAQSTGDEGLAREANTATAALQRLQIEGLTGTDAAIVNLRASWEQLQRTFAQSTVDAGVNAVTQLFTDIATGSESAGEALRNFVRNFAASMAQIAARALATYAVLQLLEAVAPGSGKLLGLTASVQHRGGMAGTGPRRRVNPLLFAAAPRFHGGGMVGLKSDEVPAILQTGEEVLSRTDPRNAANGGNSGGGYRIVNVVDPSMAGEYLESAAGERAVLNVISRNAGAVRQTLR